mmetsp:Transcript_35454/g.63361  ORF Transcript_35454/g.63361 Transcript_35454/m.63361 type:complete len:242 (-) Transcript_35454:668-1393(-)
MDGLENLDVSDLQSLCTECEITADGTKSEMIAAINKSSEEGSEDNIKTIKEKVAKFVNGKCVENAVVESAKEGEEVNANDDTTQVNEDATTKEEVDPKEQEPKGDLVEPTADKPTDGVEGEEVKPVETAKEVEAPTLSAEELETAAAEEEAKLAKRREKWGLVEPIVKPTPKPRAEKKTAKEEVPVEAVPAATKTEPDEKLLARQKRFGIVEPLKPAPSARKGKGNERGKGGPAWKRQRTN